MEIAMTIPAKAKTGAGKTAAKAARYEGLVPAVIYGGSADPEMVAIDPRPIWKGLGERGFFAKILIAFHVNLPRHTILRKPA